MKNKQPFALAGLWASQKTEEGTVEACSILTTMPNETVRAIHDRMPVIVDPNDFDLWLDSEDVRDFQAIKELFQPYPSERMEAYQVSSWVNNVSNDDAKCIEPSNEPETMSFNF